MAKFSKQEILMGRVAEADLSPDQQANLTTLVERLNAFFANYPGPIRISSGYRRPADNASVNGAARSWHMQAAAVDLADTDGRIWAFCTANLSGLEKHGLWLEAREATPTWTHVQIYPPKSGRRIFKP